MKKKNQIHSIFFNREAEMIWRQVSKNLPRGWLSNFVSDALLKRFGIGDVKQNMIKELIRLMEVDKMNISIKQEELYELLKESNND